MDPVINAVDLALNQQKYKMLLRFAQKNRSKKSKFTFYGQFNILTDARRDYLLEQLVKLTREIYRKATIHLQDIDISRRDSKILWQVFEAIIDIATAQTDLVDNVQCLPEGLFNIALVLDSILSSLPPEQKNVQLRMVRLIESLHMKKNHDDARVQNTFINTVLYFLECALSPGKKRKSFVKRAYGMRQVLLDLPSMKEIEKEAMWHILRRCVTSEVLLSTKEGQKIITLILGMEEDNLVSMHEEIKKFMTSHPSFSSTYGNIYYEGWERALTKGQSSLKCIYERQCILDILKEAFQEQNISRVPIWRKFLAEFNLKRKDRDVAILLNRLYTGHFWYFTAKPNAIIRANAIQMFIEIFPLQDPEQTRAASEQQFFDHCSIIYKAMKDVYPLVRCCAITGACIAMSLNWEIFSSDTLKSYFKLLVNDLSCDASCSKVRETVVKGLKILLENPSAISTLRVILPKLINLFHDNSEKVRVAFCQLLIKVKKITRIKYYIIVPLNHLLARLEEDTDKIAKLIVKLIHNSYFPTHSGTSIRVFELCTLILERKASRIFFKHVSLFLGVKNSVMIMMNIVSAIHIYVKSRTLPKPVNELLTGITENRREIKELTEVLKDNYDFPCGLLEAINIMWFSLWDDFKKTKNKLLLKTFVRNLAVSLGDITVFYKGTDVWKSSCYLTGFIPQQCVPLLVGLCLKVFQTLDDEAPVEESKLVLECLCNQGQGGYVLSMIKQYIDDEIHNVNKLEGKNLEKELAKSTKCNLGAGMLKEIICTPSCQKVVVSQYANVSLKILRKDSFLGFIWKVIETNDFTYIDIRLNFLKNLFFGMTQFAILMQDKGSFDSVELVKSFTELLGKKIYELVKNSPPNYIDLLQFMAQTLLLVGGDMTLTGLLDKTGCSLLKFGQKILASVVGPATTLSLCRLLLKHISYAECLTHAIKDNAFVVHHIPECFFDIISSIKHENFYSKIPEQDIYHIKGILGKALHYLYHSEAFVVGPVGNKRVGHDIIEKVVATCMETINNEVLASDPFINRTKESFCQINAERGLCLFDILTDVGVQSYTLKLLQCHLSTKVCGLLQAVSYGIIIRKLIQAAGITRSTQAAVDVIIDNLLGILDSSNLRERDLACHLYNQLTLLRAEAEKAIKDEPLDIEDAQNCQVPSNDLDRR